MSLKTVNAETDLGKVGKGGSNARFVLCDDGVEYIVKYVKTQGQRLFINELVGALSGNLMGCDVPEFSLVKFDQGFIKSSQDLKNQKIKEGVFPGVSRIPTIIPVFVYDPVIKNYYVWKFVHVLQIRRNRLITT